MVIIWWPHKDNISNFLNQLGPILDYYMPKYDNSLLLGDFNSEMSEDAMKEFCDTYCLSNMIKEPTCFKIFLILVLLILFSPTDRECFKIALQQKQDYQTTIN